MTRLLKAFLDIALWRKTPAVLPASTFLLVLAAIVAALLEPLSDLLAPQPRHLLVLRMAFAVFVPLCFTWLVLALAKRPERFLQTGSAVLGVDVLAGVVLYPLDAAIQMVGEGKPWALPLGVALLGGYVSYIVAGANIWRAALDSGVIVGGLVSLSYFLVQVLLGQYLASPA
jgi:hypothetical protein